MSGNEKANVLTALWACTAWGDGSSAADVTNVTCPDCEVVIAADLPIEVAVHISGLHNAALPPSAIGGEVVVKPLDFQPLNPGWSNCAAESILGRYGAGVGYFIPAGSPTSVLLPSRKGMTAAEMLTEAKAAAQADYERRIRSALATPPAPAATGAGSVEAALLGFEHGYDCARSSSKHYVSREYMEGCRQKLLAALTPSPAEERRVAGDGS